MKASMSIRDLTRNGKMIANYDYIDIEDKKSKEYKGVFISAKYAKKVKDFLEKEIKKEREEQVNEILKFAGTLNGESKDKTIQELKEDKVYE